MKKALKDTTRFICAMANAAVLRIIQKHKSRVVLYYHGVKQKDMENFRKQIAYLAKECFVVKPSDIYNVSHEANKTIVALTFDDAFGNLLDNALPILREYHLPAAIFVPTGRVGRCPDWAMQPDCSDRDEIVMDERQLVELDKEGFEILSHTVSHPNLTELNEMDLETELVESKQYIENLLGHEVHAVSYPYGAYNTRVLRIARRIGYRFGFTTDFNIAGHDADALRIGRFEVSPSDPLVIFKLKANGAYQANRFLINLKRMLTQRLRYEHDGFLQPPFPLDLQCTQE